MCQAPWGSVCICVCVWGGADVRSRHVLAGGGGCHVALSRVSTLAGGVLPSYIHTSWVWVSYAPQDPHTIFSRPCLQMEPPSPGFYPPGPPSHSLCFSFVPSTLPYWLRLFAEVEGRRDPFAKVLPWLSIVLWRKATTLNKGGLRSGPAKLGEKMYVCGCGFVMTTIITMGKCTSDHFSSSRAQAQAFVPAEPSSAQSTAHHLPG